MSTKTAGYTPTEREPAALAPAVTISYAPTPDEKLAIARHRARVAARRKFPELKATTDGTGVAQIASDHKDETTALALQLDALGLGSHREFTSILKGVCNFTSHRGAVSAGNLTEALSLVVGMEPHTTTEAMLAVQMAAVHLATMEAARRLNSTPGSFESITCHAKALNNLTRTFAAQTEAMKKLKGGGQQKVIVEHKHYYLAPGAIANSQAILGDVSQGGGVRMKSSDNQMNDKPAFPNAPQCTATSKRTGCRCRAPAVTGWRVCRFHGARGGAPSGPANGQYRHGFRTKGAMAERAYLRELIQETSELLGTIT